MKNLLVVGVDSTLCDAYQLARQVFPDSTVESFFVPSKDYYEFDLSGLACFSPEVWSVFVAVNEFYINDVRRALFEGVQEFGYQAVSLVSPSACLGDGVRVGKNVMVSSGCFVGAETTLGDCCVLRANVVLGDNVSIGEYVTLEANVSMRELCKVGGFTTVCANSSFVRDTAVGEHCYLNLSKQYSGIVPACTFYSPMFENPVRVLPG